MKRGGGSDIAIVAKGGGVHGTSRLLFGSLSPGFLGGVGVFIPLE